MRGCHLIEFISMETGMRHVLFRIVIGILVMTTLTTTVSSQSSISITVKSPNGGEIWAKGSKQTIKWDSSGVKGTVKLLLIKGETVFGDIELDAPAQGSINWAVGDCPASGHSAEPGRGYRIRIISVENPSIRDDSNAPFMITPRSPRSEMDSNVSSDFRNSGPL